MGKKPKLNEYLKSHKRNLKANEQAFKWLEKAVAKEDSRPVLTIGKVIDVYGQKAALTTDGYRLHINWENVGRFAESILFKKSVQDAIDSKYPAVQAIIPKYQSMNHLTVYAVSELIQAVKLAMVFAKDSANSVKFSYKPFDSGLGTLRVSAVSSEYGDIESFIDVKCESIQPFEICLNGQYVLDALSYYGKACKESIDLYYNTSKQAVLLGTPLQAMAMIMPMAFNGQDIPAHPPQPKPEQTQPTQYTPPQPSRVLYLDADVIVKVS